MKTLLAVRTKFYSFIWRYAHPYIILKAISGRLEFYTIGKAPTEFCRCAWLSIHFLGGLYMTTLDGQCFSEFRCFSERVFHVLNRCSRVQI